MRVDYLWKIELFSSPIVKISMCFQEVSIYKSWNEITSYIDWYCNGHSIYSIKWCHFIYFVLCIDNSDLLETHSDTREKCCVSWTNPITMIMKDKIIVCLYCMFIIMQIRLIWYFNTFSSLYDTLLRVEFLCKIELF